MEQEHCDAKEVCLHQLFKKQMHPEDNKSLLHKL